MSIYKKTLTGIGAAICAAAFAGAAQAATLEIKVTNNQAAGGLSITPLYTALHDGSFDAFTVGDAASGGIESIAETGMAGAVAAERLAADPNSAGQVLASADAVPPIQPGESASATFKVKANSALYFTYLAMLLPSNDHFIGNDDPLAFQVFDNSGAFTGPLTINVTGNQIYDAGTEANGLTGAAFIQGQDIAASPTGEGSISQGLALSAELTAPGVTLATGDTLDAGLIDFTTAPASFDLLTIEINRVAPVPLPASAPLMLAALGFLGWRSRRRAHH